MGDVKWTPYGGVAADVEVPKMAARIVREWKDGLLTDPGPTVYESVGGPPTAAGDPG